MSEPRRIAILPISQLKNLSLIPALGARRVWSGKCGRFGSSASDPQRHASQVTVLTTTQIRLSRSWHDKTDGTRICYLRDLAPEIVLLNPSVTDYARERRQLSLLGYIRPSYLHATPANSPTSSLLPFLYGAVLLSMSMVPVT
jgi:hypothetical protein